MSLNPRSLSVAEAGKRICCGPHHHSAAGIHGLCVGPMCMAWRWTNGGHQPAKAATNDAEAVAAHNIEPTEGVCGLIGE